MPEFQFLNAELLAFIGVMLVYTRLRKQNHLGLSMINGLTLYMPP